MNESSYRDILQRQYIDSHNRSLHTLFQESGFFLEYLIEAAEGKYMKYLPTRCLVISSILLVSGCGLLKDVRQPVSLESTAKELGAGRHEISAVSTVQMSGVKSFDAKAREACGGDFTVEDRSSPPRVVGTVKCAEKAPMSAKETLRLSQEKLTELGYNPGPADGLMGNRTRTAIKRFQRDYKLDETGTIDAKTLNILNM